MGYRRLFIIRKDLQLSPGKLAAMVGHCAEAYWTRMLSRNVNWLVNGLSRYVANKEGRTIPYEMNIFKIDQGIFDHYINGSFVKTICEAKNRNQLLKAKTMAEELGLIEDVDFGIINDRCLTELTPENEDGTTTVGIWFKPLPDEVAHQISKKYQLYK